MGIEPYDVTALEKAVNDGASRASTLWLSFLSFITYLAVAVGSVTHRALFLEKEIRLPLLGADLPLVGFFLIAPLLLLIFHFYLFLQLVILDRKISTYNDVLRRAVTDPVDRVPLRRRLDSFFLVQLLAGTPQERKGITATFLRAAIGITMVLAPIAVLFLVQLIFLPYHHALVTWCHRLAIVIDLALIWTFWPVIYRTDDAIRAPSLRRHPVALTASATAILFSVFIATYPGEWINNNWFSRALDYLVKIDVAGERLPLSAALFLGPTNMVTGKPRSLFSSVLVVANEKFVDDEKIEKLERSVSLRGRDLRGAVFINSDLRKADFTGANLMQARFDAARLGDAAFDCKTTGRRTVAKPEAPPVSSVEWPDDGCTWLQGASFIMANLTRASLNGARLEESTFYLAQLRDAAMDSTQLQGAKLAFAELQGASLKNARLEGIRFTSTALQGAIMDQAHLEGAVFAYAKLQGASLTGAKLTGAVFKDSDLSGADMEDANLDLAVIVSSNLQGTSLRAVSLKGAIVSGSALHGADLTQTSFQFAQLVANYVWRATVSDKTEFYCTDAFVGLESKRVYPTNISFALLSEDKPFNDTLVYPLIAAAVEYVTEPDRRSRIWSRFEPLWQDSAFSSADAKNETLLRAARLNQQRCRDKNRLEEMSKVVKETVCRTNDDKYHGSPHVAEVAIEMQRIKTFGPYSAELAKTMLDTATCSGAAGISKKATDSLKAFVNAQPRPK